MFVLASKIELIMYSLSRKRSSLLYIECSYTRENPTNQNHAATTPMQLWVEFSLKHSATIKYAVGGTLTVVWLRLNLSIYTN